MTQKLDPTNPLRKPRATKAEMIERREARHMQPGSHTYLPGLVQEREKMFLERQKKLAASTSVATGIRICNSTAPRDYRTGNGEVFQAQRPGADQHEQHPSLHMGVRVYRGERS